jgi:polyhydroxyalkanoate synthesis regulator phasin
MKMAASMLILGGLFAVGAAQAGTPGAPRSELREQRQEARIDQGVASGELTVAEARRLDRGQARVDLAQRAAAADGVVTVREKRRLEQLQDHQSQRIARHKHDPQRRYD